MTVQNNGSRDQYTATSGQTTFPYTFEIFDKADLAVDINGTLQSEGTNYSVAGVGADNGGTITLTVGATTNDVVTIYRNMPFNRLNDYQQSGDFLANEVNDDFDRLWLAAQQTDFNSLKRTEISDDNAMLVDLDMNGNRILNLPEPLLLEEPLRLKDLLNFPPTLANIAYIYLPLEDSYSSSSINSALTSAFSRLPNGGVIELAPGTMNITADVVVPENVTIKGQGQFATQVTRTLGDYSFTLSTGSALEDLQLFSAVSGAWVEIPTGTLYQKLLSVSIRTANSVCVSIAPDGGQELEITGCNIGTANQAVAGIALTGTDTAAQPRHFSNNSGSGSPLYDFSGMNGTYVTGGFTLGFFSNASTGRMMLNNLRVGNNPTITDHPIYGSNNVISNCVFSGFVTLFTTDSRIDAICSDFNFIDEGTGNSVEIRSRNYTSDWTATVINPTIGNGAFNTAFSRSGGAVTVTGEIRIGSTTDTGSGIWSITLPVTAKSFAWDQPCAGIFEAVGAAKPFQYQGSCIIPTSNRDTVQFRLIDQRTNFLQSNTGAEVTAASNKIVLSGYSYNLNKNMAQVYQNGVLLTIANGDYTETSTGGLGIDFNILTTIDPADVFTVIIEQPDSASVVGGVSSTGDTWEQDTRFRFQFTYIAK